MNILDRLDEAERETTSPPRVSVADVGTYWTRADGSLWRIVLFGEHPTVTWERMDGPLLPREPAPERRGGSVGSPITDGFIRLVPESDAKGAA